ncbi:hypothetical protein FOZ61_005206 [Perkinsus olseni]|uniref:Uncharacterized protein n=1 Tax=Perkinsus olseni TaxID=32597 RepID=A0A7J6LI98_PEROL|nr:hypothetical protein FOZ61_005206 [Perkinsus olseni]KAF4663536.1 hypothetical protein FOL46_004690 [Perkinsus olseni]
MRFFFGALLIHSLLQEIAEAFFGLDVVRPKGPRSPGECMISSKAEGVAVFDYGKKLHVKALICKMPLNVKGKKKRKKREMIIFDMNEGRKFSEMLDGLTPTESQLPEPKPKKKKGGEDRLTAGFRDCRAGVANLNKFNREVKRIEGVRQTKALVKFLCRKAVSAGVEYYDLKEGESTPEPGSRAAAADGEEEEESGSIDEDDDEDDGWGRLRRIQVEELYK